MGRCPSCDRLAEVVLPTLQMLERRVRLLEGGAALPARAAKQNALERREREALIDALSRSDGVQSVAASHLGVSARVFHYKVHKHNLQAYCRFTCTRRPKE